MTGLIVIPILATLGSIASYKLALKLSSKASLKYKKRIIKKMLRQSISDGDWELFQVALAAIKDYDLNQKTDKFALYLLRFGIPSNITESIDAFGDWIEEKKNDIVDLLEEEIEEKKEENNQMLIVIDEAIEKTFEIELHKSALNRKVFDDFKTENIDELPALIKKANDFNLTELLENVKQNVKISIKKEIPNEINLDQMFARKMKTQMMRKAALKRQAALRASSAAGSHSI
tara:strand:- start:250 stop:945 length:696 start_codon:yes stop_codon:yes gene_type:complete